MYHTFGFSEYHRKRSERRENITILCCAVGIVIFTIGFLCLLAFLV